MLKGHRVDVAYALKLLTGSRAVPATCWTVSIVNIHSPTAAIVYADEGSCFIVLILELTPSCCTDDDVCVFLPF